MIEETRGLLAGIRVVEVGRHIAAPVVGMLLAEQGAEVIRVVDPASPPRDPVLDALLSRGKTEVSLGLAGAGGQGLLNRLVSQADIVVEDGPAGTMCKLGVCFDTIRSGANPGLISCSIPGFPPAHPASDLPDYEAVVGALGYLYDKPIGKPQLHDFPLGSVIGALFASNAIAAALVARLRTGRGQHIDTTRYHSDIFAQILLVLVKTGVPRGFLPLKMIGTPFMGSWLCGDERYIYLHITLPDHNRRILEVLEGLGYGDDVRALREEMSPETVRDPSQVRSIPEAKRIREIYERIFRSRSAQEWEDVLGKELCCIKIRTIEEWLEDSLEAGMEDARSVEDPVFGKLMGPGPAVTAPDLPPIVRPRMLGDAPDVLERWERDARCDAAIEAKARSEGTTLAHPLDGLKVLDLSRVIAGPCAARVLAELGADVLSVQRPIRLDWALSFHLLFNAGKRSVTIDYRTDEGKKTLWSVIDDLAPDVFIQNYRHMKIAKTVGVDLDAVRARYPQVVYTHLNAYGDKGVWRLRPGFEQVVQAVSGIQMSYGRGGRPKLVPTPVIDIGSGLMGAFGTILGVYHQRKHRESVFTTTHLTRMSVLFQIGHIAEYQRSRCIGDAAARGQAVRFDPGQLIVAGILRARDAFVCVAGPRTDVELWLRHVGFSASDRELFARTRLWLRSAAHWQSTLADAGVGATVAIVPIPSLRTLVSDIQSVDSSPLPPVRKRDYTGCPSQLTFVQSPIRMSLTPARDVPPPPMRGEHTREVLGRLGEPVPDDGGVIEYPRNKPLHVWAATFVRWGYFAWRSGNI